MKIHEKIGSVEITLDTSRIDGNLREAQKELNVQIAKDCKPFVPKRIGALRDSVQYPQGIYGGEISWGEGLKPYARYQYRGEIYGPNIPIKDAKGNLTGWFSPPEEKKHPTGRYMKNYSEPGTGSQWFEKAKSLHKQEWIKLVKETAGKK